MQLTAPIVPCLVLGLVAGLTGPTAASPVDLFGFGARGQGMGNAVVATASGFESTYYNPAGLAFDTRPTFAIGYQSASFDLTANGDAFDARDAPVLTIGFGVPIPFGGPLADRVAIGLGFAIPQKSILIADIERPGQPTFPVVENRAQTVSIMGSLAVRAADWLAVGVGAITLAELEGQIAVAPGPEGNLSTRVRDELLADYAFIGGITARPTDWLHVGLTYRGESRADFTLPIEADLGEDFQIPLPELLIIGTAQYDPAEVGLELAVTPDLGVDALSRWVIAVGAAWQQWSEAPIPIVYTAVPEDTPPQPPLGYHDTISLRFGTEAVFAIADTNATLTPRLGAAWEPSPVPDQTGFHNHLDGDRAILSLGLGASWGPLRLDIAGQVHLLAERTHTKDPARTDAETNPGFPTISGQGTIFMGSLELGITL